MILVIRAGWGRHFQPNQYNLWKLKTLVGTLTQFEVTEAGPEDQDQDRDGLLGQVDLGAGAEEEGGECAGRGTGQLG